MFVLPSIRTMFLRSTRSSKCAKKSAPIIAWLTSADRKLHVNFRLSPRSVEMNFVPYDLIAVPLAACSRNDIGPEIFSLLDAGTIDTSEPVSMRNRRPLVLSNNKRRRLEKTPPTSADSGEQRASFFEHYTGREVCNAELVDHTSDDTNTFDQRFSNVTKIDFDCRSVYRALLGDDETLR